MCNNYQSHIPQSVLEGHFDARQRPMTWAQGHASNLPPQDNIRIRDIAPVIGLAADGGVKLAMRPWAWLAPNGKPVFNFRSDGRDFSRSTRVLLPADGFFEFTAPAHPEQTGPKQKKKDRWRFTLAGHDWFFIAGVMQQGCFSLLTLPPGPDIAPYHDRQIVILTPEEGLAWLDHTPPLPGFATRPVGSFKVQPA